MGDLRLTVQPPEPGDRTTVLTAIARVLEGDHDFQQERAYVRGREAAIERFIEPGKTPVAAESAVLVVLRRWNSFTPLLPRTSDSYSKGGGYFLRIGDQGIVIDPGFNFVENFLRTKHKLDDIDHVLISHAHNDHTVELEGLFSLLQKRNDRAGADPKKINLYMNLGSFKKFAGYFDLSSPPPEFYIDRITLLNEHQLVPITPDVDLFTARTKHREMITAKYALGFTMRIATPGGVDRIVKFTCDTGWDEEMEELNHNRAAEYQMEEPDILVPHIGTVRDSELDYGKPGKVDSDCFVKYHLGMLGTIAQMQRWQPELTLLSEFGEELNAVRHLLAERIQRVTRRTVFATDLFFRVDLSTLGVMCFRCRDFFPASDIKTRLGTHGQLYYYNEAILTPEEKMDQSVFEAHAELW